MRKLPLRQQLTLGLLVFVTAGVVSGLFAFLATFAGPRQGELMPSWIIGLSAGTVVGAMYLALAGNKRVALADDAARAAALAPDAGETRLLVFRQGFVGKLQGIDILVDGAVRAQLKSPRFAVLALPPGDHVVETQMMGKRSAPLAVPVAAGETAAVQVHVSLGKARPERRPDVAAVRAALASVPMVVA